MKEPTLRNVTALLTAAAVFSADRLVKYWCVRVLKPLHSLPVLEGILSFTYVENTGAAFSMLSGRRWLLVLLALASLALIVGLFFSRAYAHPLMDTALALVAGGAIGNLADRIRVGYVVDFIELRFVRFAIFNVADCAITVGAGLMLLYAALMLREELAEADRQKNQGEEA